MKWAGDVACMGEMRNAHILVEKPERDHSKDKGTDGRIDLTEIRWKGGDWI
jgi:hypothetical protein